MRVRYLREISLCFIVMTACLLNRIVAKAQLPSSENDMPLCVADPTVVVWQGAYYLTGTDDPGGSREFVLYRSQDMKTWKRIGTLLRPGKDVYGTRGFWAPQWKKTDNRWLLLYTANEHVAIAESDTPMDVFRGRNGKPLDSSEKNIDPYLFLDDDGRWYLYHVRFNHGNYLWVGEMNIQRMRMDKHSLQRCFSLSQQWEHTQAYHSEPVMEGPTVVKRNGKYYMFYSANHFLSPDYAVGYAFADSPTGPWHKAEHNPILSRDVLGERGTGHGDVFEGLDGQLYYVYHTHSGEQHATPRQTRIVPLHSRENPINDILEWYINPDEVIKCKLIK